MSTPAEELRAAATLIRETAVKAAQGHPVPWHAEPDFNRWWHVATPAPHLVTSAAREPVAAWIALMSPALAEPLAAWLEDIADEAERHAAEGWGNDQAEITDGHPTSLARSILGRTS